MTLSVNKIVDLATEAAIATVDAHGPEHVSAYSAFEFIYNLRLELIEDEAEAEKFAKAARLIGPDYELFCSVYRAVCDRLQTA